MKHYVILTRFSYSEPGHSRSCILRFETDCELDDLPRLYQAWMKGHVAEEGVNERHYGRKKVIGAYEAIIIPAHDLDAAIKAAYADIDAENDAIEKAEEARTMSDAELREREEFVRLSAKFAVT